MIKRWLYIFLGLSFLALAVVGAFVPLLPSTPFGLLALFCFSRSSPFLHRQVLRMPVLGQALQEWQDDRSISLMSKAIAVSFLLFSLFFVHTNVLVPVPIKLLASTVILGISGYILSRKTTLHNK